MIKHLHYLLSTDHLFNITVQFPKAALLSGIISLTSASAEPDIPEHRDVAHHHNQRQARVEHKQQRQRSHHLNEALNHHGETVVQSVGDGINIIGKKTHDIPVASGIKKFQRQGLDMGKQISSDIKQNSLGSLHHSLGISPCSHNSYEKDCHSEQHSLKKSLNVSPSQPIYHWADHISSKKICQCTYRYQNRNDQQKLPVFSHIGKEKSNRLFHIFRLFSTISSGRHLHPLLSSVTGKFPGK